MTTEGLTSKGAVVFKSVGEDIILPKTNEYPRADGIRPYMEKC